MSKFAWFIVIVNLIWTALLANSVKQDSNYSHSIRWDLGRLEVQVRGLEQKLKVDKITTWTFDKTWADDSGYIRVRPRH